MPRLFICHAVTYIKKQEARKLTFKTSVNKMGEFLFECFPVSIATNRCTLPWRFSNSIFLDYVNRFFITKQYTCQLLIVCFFSLTFVAQHFFPLSTATGVAGLFTFTDRGLRHVSYMPFFSPCLHSARDRFIHSFIRYAA